MKTAIKETETYSVHGAEFGHHITEDQAAQRFSAAVYHLSEGELAQASRKSKDTAKSWKARRRCPHLANAINVARQYPAVRAWLIAEIGGADSEFYAAQADLIMAHLPPEVRKILGHKP